MQMWFACKGIIALHDTFEDAISQHRSNTGSRDLAGSCYHHGARVTHAYVLCCRHEPSCHHSLVQVIAQYGISLPPALVCSACMHEMRGAAPDRYPVLRHCPLSSNRQGPRLAPVWRAHNALYFKAKLTARVSFLTSYTCCAESCMLSDESVNLHML